LTSHLTFTLLGLGRLTLAVAVLYGLACWIFPLRTSAWMGGERRDARWARAVLIGALATVLVQTMALAGVYDGLMLVGGLLLIAAGAMWKRYRSEQNRLYTRLLEWADRSGSAPGEPSATAHDRSLPWSALPAVLLGGLVLGSAALRLGPFGSSPAFFSLTPYRLLETAKHLQANQLFPGGMVEARGLHGLSVALHALSEVDLALVIRMLGILASVFLVVGIYIATRGYSEDAGAALGAAALFGLGLPVLPLALENQVEPTTALLAAACALPAWYFLLRYQTSGARAHLGVGAAGLLFLVLTDGSVATLLIPLLIALGLLQLALASTPVRRRRAAISTGLSAAAGAVLGSLALVRYRLAAPDPYTVPPLSVETGGSSLYPPDLSLLFYGLLVGGTACTLLVVALVDRRDSFRRASLSLALLCPALYGAWAVPGAWPGANLLDPTAAITLLSVFLPVALGGLFAWISAQIRARTRSVAGRPVLRSLYYGAVPGALVAVLVFSPLPLRPTMDAPVEPPGYVQAIHAIQEAVGPYEWTVVSHYGTAVRAMNQGRFLEYDYFLRHYNPDTYDHAALKAIPTEHLFLFAPTNRAVRAIREELLVSGHEGAASMQRWCEEYRTRTGTLSPFYSDETLTVYHLTRAPVPRQLETLFSRSLTE